MVDSSWTAAGPHEIQMYKAATGVPAWNTAVFTTNEVPIDLQASSRMQHIINTAFGLRWLAFARASFRVSRVDLFRHLGPNVVRTRVRVVFAFAPEPALGGESPTMDRIIAASGTAGFRVTSSTAIDSDADTGWTGSGDARYKTLSTQPLWAVNDTNADRFPPGTKIWVCAYLELETVREQHGAVPPPTLISSFARLRSAATDLPIPARALSFWTNRQPDAPVVTSPSSGLVIDGGNAFNLTVGFRDPDRAIGSFTPSYSDVAGVQVQYAPQVRPGDPTPTWIDLPFADSAGATRKGWWIAAADNHPDESLDSLVTTGTVPLMGGSNAPVAGHGALPSGAWQIRVRAFDYGHPVPLTQPPLGPSRDPLLNTPANYPAANTSAWSTPVLVTVASQVPPPLPLYPTQNIAVVHTADIGLSWQYRNAALPPFPQGSRSVQMRKVGESSWTDLLVDDASSSATHVITDLDAGRAYEWRVQVVDTDGVRSDWSQVGRFWAVVPPGSGGVQPLPSGTIDGATLGCGTHRAFVYRRGGERLVGEITEITSLEWERVRDEISVSKIKVTGWSKDCGALLAILQPWAYEVVIFRDNGFSQDRVWEGPITLLTYEADSVTIQCRDVMAYAYRRIIKQTMTDTATGATVVDRAKRILQNVFAPDDPNLLGYLTPLVRSDDARQRRSIPAYARTAYEEIDDMAANAGLDYTAVGRRIMLWGTRHRIGTLPEFRDSDLGHAPIVSVYGMSFANRYVVADGNGLWGEATEGLDPVSGNDPNYGLVEILSSSWAADAEAESGEITAESQANNITSFKQFAQRAISDRNPPPVVVRVPDNTSLNPDAAVSIQHLIPGVVIPLRSTGGLRSVVASQKLDSVRVSEQGGLESITVTMSPFSRDDANTDTEAAE